MIFTPLGNDLVAVADTSMALGIRNNFLKKGFHEHIKQDNESRTESFQFKKEELDGFAKWLKWKGFTVIRVPILNKLERAKEIIPWCTYNNVLVELFENKKRVYMPVYDIEELDNLAAKTYADLEFEVRRISGIRNIAVWLGALRCSTKVLERN
jgi:hypothetical protein